MANENKDLGMFRGLIVWGLIFMLLVLLFSLLSNQKTVENEMKFSEFLERLEKGEIIEVTIKERDIEGRTADRKFHTYSPDYPGLVDRLNEKGVAINAKPADGSPWYELFFYSWGPIIFLVLIWVFFMRQMQGGGNKAMSFGKSKARLVSENQVKVTFSDVAGIEEAKEEVQEIIDFLRDPQKFMKLGALIPKGVLLVGSPGTGKTLLGRAIAGEAGVPFYSISGSDFVEMFVGVGASRVRDLFEQAKKNAPCIVFIDEIDAVGRHRGAGLGGGHDEREQTLNQLLVEMDGFEGKEGVIILAATNRPDVLDPALLRPGRFDRQVVVPLPDVKGREAIIKVHTKEIPADDTVDIVTIAKGTPGFSGADLANLVNEAALLAARKDKSSVSMTEFEEAKDKVMMGAARKSMIINDEEKKNTAYHEAGHALAGLLTPGTDPVHKVTIIPRGRAMGLTWYLPEEDKYTHSRDFLQKQLITLMGGRVAEEVALGNVTTGAGNDIERATDIARKMVTAWGMSEKLGPLSFGKKEEQIFLGREISQHKDYSEKTAEEIDGEVRRFVTEAYESCKKLITDNFNMLDKLAKALLEEETMDSLQIRKLLGLPIPEEAKLDVPSADQNITGPITEE